MGCCSTRISSITRRRPNKSFDVYFLFSYCFFLNPLAAVVYVWLHCDFCHCGKRLQKCNGGGTGFCEGRPNPFGFSDIDARHRDFGFGHFPLRSMDLDHSTQSLGCSVDLFVRNRHVDSLDCHCYLETSIHRKGIDLKNHELKTDGIYTWVRHPSYTGMYIYGLGYGMALQSPISLLLVMVGVWVSTRLRIPLEEAVLTSHFGESYKKYQSRTWRLFPGLY